MSTIGGSGRGVYVIRVYHGAKPLCELERKAAYANEWDARRVAAILARELADPLDDGTGVRCHVIRTRRTLKRIGVSPLECRVSVCVPDCGLLSYNGYRELGDCEYVLDYAQMATTI